jgi:FkbM family methyltransferase
MLKKEAEALNQLRVTLRNVLRQVFPKQMHARAVSHARWAEIEEDLLPIVVDPERESMDIGANVGRYAIALAKLSRRVYAFEPDQELSAFLRRAAPDNVRVFSGAVSAAEGEAHLRVPLDKEGRPIVTLASLTEVPDCPFEVRTVKTITLDQFSDENVGFMKIDAEGHELEILRGAQVLLRRQRPIILVEIDGRERREAIQSVRDLLAPLGYSGFFVLDKRTHGIEEFRPDLQNSLELERPILRRDMRYVNNFFFAPSAAASTIRDSIDRYYGALIEAESD